MNTKIIFIPIYEVCNYAKIKANAWSEMDLMPL